MRHGWMLAGAALAVACAGGIRPSYAPMPEARADTVAGATADVVQAIGTGLAAEGMQAQWQSGAEGYVETQWYDLVSRESGNYNRTQPERYVRLRFFVDPAGPGMSAITSEAVILHTTDPSVMERDAEMMVPPTHAGRALLDRVIGHARNALNR